MILLKYLKLMFSEHKIMLALIISVQAVTCISLLFSYCQYRQSQFEAEKYFEISGNYEIQFQIATVKDVRNFLNNCKYSNFEKIEITLDEEANVISVPFGKNLHVNYGNNFSSENAKEVILPKKTQSDNNLSLDDEYTVLGENYKLVGMRADNLTELNFNALPDNMNVCSMKISCISIPSKSEVEKTEEYIEAAFNKPIITTPQTRNLITETSFDTSILISVILAILSLINITFIYSYLLNQRKNSIAILKICGLCSKKSHAVCICEISIYIIISVFIASIIFTVIKRFFHFSSITFYDYTVPNMIFIALSLLIIINRIRSINKIPLAEIIKDGDD